MHKENYTLKTILQALSKTKNNTTKRRLIYDQSRLNGISAKWIIAFFISLPILLYIGIFNETVFSMLGIAQAIIFYIVFLSMVMILIVAIAFINNNKVVRQVEPAWQKYFPGIDLRLVLSSGATPYRDFFKHYNKAVNKHLEGEALYVYMKEAFKKMQEENRDMLEAMQREQR